MNALFTAIYNKFNATTKPDLWNDVTGRMFHYDAPQKAAFPYITYALVSDVSSPMLGGEEYDEVQIEFQLVSNTSSATEACTMYGHCISLFDDCALTISGYTHVYMQRELSSLDHYAEDGIWVYYVDYRIFLRQGS